MNDQDVIIFTDDDTLTEEEKEELFNGAEEPD